MTEFEKWFKHNPDQKGIFEQIKSQPFIYGTMTEEEFWAMCGKLKREPRPFMIYMGKYGHKNLTKEMRRELKRRKRNG